MLNIGELDDGMYHVLVAWVGLDGEGPSWEPAGDNYYNMPRFLENTAADGLLGGGEARSAQALYA